MERGGGLRRSVHLAVVDVDGDGRADVVLPVCRDEECADSEILMSSFREGDTWLRLATKDTFKGKNFVLPSKEPAILQATMTLR